ncbi:MAG TPA: type I phosphomannose isomerase catalytic subunit [Pirellulales bacterium]|nr:type I phosphomannose isomerase catalytic subunit [Pirellulales bacterium]
MTPLYPLRFEPFFRRLPWGGRRLESLLGKRLPPGDDYAESWEVADHGVHQSRVAAGPLAGCLLSDLVRERGQDLLGRHWPQAHFPLLLKFLDARHSLSVQVHPDDARAARLEPTQCGKSETWVVLAAEPGSLLYAGLRVGVDRQAFERSLAEGRCPECLHAWYPQAGDCFWLPAGSVHALGAGVAVAELQQPSDCTYRLFDWNRRDAQGRLRTLQLEQGLDAIDYGLGPLRPIAPQSTSRPQVERLVATEYFVLERWRLAEPQTAGGDQMCRVVAVQSGTVEAAGEGFCEVWPPGTTVVLPASSTYTVSPAQSPAVLLVAHLP